MNAQLHGMDELAGTYLFDLRASIKALRLNRFLWNLRLEDCRERFVLDENGEMCRAALTDEEQSLIRNRDWLGLVRYGANFFVLEKFARVVKLSNLEVYAAMRGESYADFLKTRRVPDAR